MKKIVNDLFDYKNLKIVQGADSFKFSIDSILLAEYVENNLDSKKIIDFCTGNAPIPLILSTKTSSKLIGFEIQKPIYEMALDSIKFNNKQDQIEVFNDDIINIKKYFDRETFDVVTCNPPYFKRINQTLINENEIKAIARHEIKINLDQIIESAAYLLKNKGCLYLVHRPERLEEMMEIFKKYHFFAKKLQFIYPKFDKNANMVLIKAVKNGNIGLKVLKPIELRERKTYQNLVGE